jgi:Rrf2 family protein
MRGLQGKANGKETRTWAGAYTVRLSTKSCVGTRIVLDLARHYNEGPVKMWDLAQRLNVSVKYLEQVVIPLKKAGYVESVVGRNGGHLLKKAPDKITVGEILRVLEHEVVRSDCVEDPNVCDKSNHCVTRALWGEATRLMYDKLDSITFSEMIRTGRIV